MGKATQVRIAALRDPDVALVALAYNLAAQLDDPDRASAAGAREYRQTIQALTAGEAPKAITLDDLDDLDDEDA